MSPPTVGRRMLALERSLGRSLFHRSPTGYLLSVDGEALAERVKSMEKAARSIADWQQEVLALPIVSVATDTLTLRYVMANLRSLWSEADSFRVCLKVVDGEIDLTYRDAHVAVTARAPQSGNLAVKRSVPRAYCAYRAWGAARPNRERWISIGTDVATAPWLRWTFEHHDLPIEAWTNTPRSMLDLAVAGGGNAVLPCFVGDADPGLERAGAPIDELRHESWIVAHDDDRRRPEVRAVLDRIDKLMKCDRDLFSGERPRAGID